MTGNDYDRGSPASFGGVPFDSPVFVSHTGSPLDNSPDKICGNCTITYNRNIVFYLIFNISSFHLVLGYKETSS